MSGGSGGARPQTVGAQRAFSPRAQITTRCCQGPGPPVPFPQKPGGAGAVPVSLLPIRERRLEGQSGRRPRVESSPSTPEWHCSPLLRIKPISSVPPISGSVPPSPCAHSPLGLAGAKAKDQAPSLSALPFVAPPEPRLSRTSRR